MKQIVIPRRYNYIGVFLTFACPYRCSYCINYFEENMIRRAIITGKEWVTGLNRIVSRPDLPVTLQGGEPSCHPDFYYIVNNIKPELNIDLLTNLSFDIDEFMRNVKPDRIRRDSPYASIRVSYHPEVMDLDKTIEKVIRMQNAGYSIGIWGVTHPKQLDIILKAQARCKALGIDFRTKEFLGEYDGKMYGKYLYKDACGKKTVGKVQCRTTELIIDSSGLVHRCHYELYKGINPVGSIVDPDFEISEEFTDCGTFGHCNPCDVKVKTNRFQVFGHTSVEIKGAQIE